MTPSTSSCVTENLSGILIVLLSSIRVAFQLREFVGSTGAKAVDVFGVLTSETKAMEFVFTLKAGHKFFPVLFDMYDVCIVPPP